MPRRHRTLPPLPIMTLDAVGRRALLMGGLGAAAGFGAGRGRAAAAIPIDVAGGHCAVTVMMDGRPARMLLDTGAERSVVTRDAQLRLGLQPDQWVSTTLRGAGDVLERHANAVVGSARLGGIALVQRGLPGGLSLSVTTSDLAGADGLLGGDVLRHATLYLDVPRRRLLLFPPEQGVRGGVALQSWRGDLLLAPVRLDDRALIALVDTGASASLINARGLYRLGLSDADLARDPARDSLSIGGVLSGRGHRFRELSIAPLTVANPVLIAVAVPEAAWDVTLGMDVLGLRPMLLSYAALRLGFNAG